jgi:teichuronic acid biosynthesis glycosyltransferase TuaC
MRILCVTGDFPSEFNHVGGIFIYKQMLALQRLGHELFVLRVVPLAPPIGAKWQKYRALKDRYRYDGIDVEVARTVVLPGLRNFEHLRAQTIGIMKRAIARTQPHVVHAQYLQYPGSISVGRGRPTVITSHGIDAYDWPWRREALRKDAARTLRAAETVVAVSGFIATQLRHLADRPVEVVFNGGDAEVFRSADRRAAREELQLPQERRVLAFAGTLCVDKGIFDLVEALRGLDDPPLLLALGDGPDATAFAAALRAAEIDVRLFGNVSQSTVASAFAAADAVTLPSHKEGLPVTVCEAMLSARCVVATAVGGIPEIVRDGDTGFLAEPHDIARLRFLYRRVLHDPGVAAAAGERAARFAREHLTWEANARAYARIYRRIVGERAA